MVGAAMLAQEWRPTFTLDGCEVDLGRRELRMDGAPVPVGARAFKIIETLVRSSGELVTKDELMSQVWPDVVVNDNTLQVHISAVRKAIGAHRSLLRTESGRGYRLLGDWAPQASPPAPGLWQRQAPSRGQPAPNLPIAAAALVGRSPDVQRLRDLLSAYRAVTLTGPGGIGKTALALHVARELVADFADGVRLVELASLPDASLVPSTVCSALGLDLGGSAMSPETIARAISGRNLLLLLDNCEHVIDTAAELIAMMLRWCPRITVLATSREVLRIDGEYVYRVSPLAVPEEEHGGPENLLSHSAVELFVTRAGELDSNYVSRVDSLPSVAEICRHLDGIPLAIEFAAARAVMLGVDAVANGLANRFALLTGGRRTALPRHQTLRATLDWSYELLPETERRLLRHLAVFPAGFTVDAAAAVMGGAVMGGAAADGWVTAEGIANLVAKSLVTLDKSDAAPRWYLLETIYAYAAEKLAEHREFDRAAGHRAAYFRDLFAGAGPGSSTHLSDADWQRGVREIDNVRATLDWCFSGAGDTALGIDLTAAYAPVWLHLSLMQECRDRCGQALRTLAPGASQARLRMWLQIDLATSLFDTMGSGRQAQELLTEALAAAETLGDLDAEAAALASLVPNYLFQAAPGKARETAERLGEAAERIGDPAVVGIADRLMGIALVMLGRPREGQRFLEKFLEARSSKKDRVGWYPADHRAPARAFLARSLWLQGFLDKAYSEAQASLDEVRATDHQLLLCRVLYFGMCRLAPSNGEFAVAEQSITRLIEAATALNAPFWQTAGHLLAGKLMIERGEFAQGVPALRGALDTCRRTGWRLSYPEFQAALATGLLGLDRLDEALDAVNEGLAAVGEGADGQDLYVAEALRVKGEVLLRRGAAALAEACFGEALELARTRETLFWELRVALSLARLRAAQGRAAEGRELLAAIYGRFTEGLGAPDLIRAKAALDELSAS
ncbi:MAG TPA: winged helix-turn-helix domain-containing protein [Stellaceae bacterium]|nr:winged helix-turn-helix domain-containing protein [Stellaceae bacterium]